jgi:hypothetical protein
VESGISGRLHSGVCPVFETVTGETDIALR